MNNIENIQEYIPTVYVNDSEPDLDETNLNKTEQAIKRVTDAANKAIDALKQLDREKLALSAISNVLSDATDKVPSLALANTMQLAINDLNSNLGAIYGLGTPIPSGANLDDYTNPGNYYSVSTANTGTLSNLPGRVKTGFRLEVIANTANSWLKQIMYPNGDLQQIWIRQLGGAWTNWNLVITSNDWIQCVLKSGITTASNNYGGKKKLSYRKTGEQIHIVGGVAVTNYTGSTVVTSLPNAYRPETTHYWLSPLTGSRIARCIIGSGGDLVIEWIKNISDGSDYTGNVSWIDMSGTFFAN